MPDRSKAPALQKIDRLHLIQPDTYTLDNGTPLHVIDMGTQEVLKLEVIFNAGRWVENDRLAARATGTLLKEGTATRNSAQIAEEIDFYGATIASSGGLDSAGLTVYCLTKHLKKLMPIVQNILMKPIFPQAELNTFIEQRCQQLMIEAEKVEVVAYRELTAALFGDEHPYGYNSTIDLYKSIRREDLEKHFKAHYHSGNCCIILSGRLAEGSVELVNTYLGQLPKGEKSQAHHQIEPYTDKKLRFTLTGALQSGVRLGRRWVSRHHEDYAGLFILNTLLGGYFGSRLMSNIREDKGYTYGIYSSVDMMLHNSYFYVGTEVATDVTQATIDEIYKEFRALQNDLVKQEELERLRNFMLGNLLSTLDGPFNVAQVNRALILENLNASFFDKIINTIKTIQPETLRTLAQQYLNPEDMTEVVVGV